MLNARLAGDHLYVVETEQEFNLYTATCKPSLLNSPLSTFAYFYDSKVHENRKAMIRNQYN